MSRPRKTFVEVGQVFGKLTVIDPDAGWVKSGHRAAQVRCDCGTVKKVSGWDLLHGKTVSCGCFLKSIRERIGQIKSRRVSYRIEIIGKTFGRLVVIAEAGRTKCGSRLLLCRCECGTEKVVSYGNLYCGCSRSCGCLHRELMAAKMLRHGHSRKRGQSPEYCVWKSMITRTTNPNSDGWSSYGGAGVRTCERWLNSFEAFLEDVGSRPKGTTLGRYLDTGDYEPGNCIWMTPAEQAAEKAGHTAMRAWHKRTRLNSGTLWEWRQPVGYRKLRQALVAEAA